jgi:hypothetical protein
MCQRIRPTESRRRSSKRLSNFSIRYLYEQYQKRIANSEDADGIRTPYGSLVSLTVFLGSAVLALPYGKSNPATILDRLESKVPSYRTRDIQNICKLYVQGKCPRGSRCPYRHEMPLTDKTSRDEVLRKYRETNADEERGGSNQHVLFRT